MFLIRNGQRERWLVVIFHSAFSFIKNRNTNKMTDNAVQFQRKTPKTRINNSQLMKDTGCRVVHNRYSGETVAFKVENNRVTFATSKCHEKDTFTKKVGTQIATTRFKNGETKWINLNMMMNDYFACNDYEIFLP